MKYESEILYDLMKRDGLLNPSQDHLPYESELKEKYIDGVKGSYPKLTDYQAEWLNYAYNEEPIGEFPYITLSDVTNATIENVVPYAYKSAILKGNTGYRDIDTGELLEAFEEGRNLELVSVKMPVLTTTGKNLFDSELELGNISGTNGTNVSSTKMARTDFIEINSSNNKLTCSVSGDYVIEKIAQYDENKNFIGRIEPSLSNYTVTLNSSSKYVRLVFKQGVNSDLFSIDDLKLLNIQIEYGNNVTEYEPFKSNILTVNEEVELRGIGDVQDTLDCLTGEVTQRIGETTLDGSEGWWMNEMEGKNTNRFRITFDSKEGNNVQTIKCGEMKSVPNQQWETDEEIIEADGVFLTIRKPFDTEKEFTNWLSQNPITIQYQAKTELIKTVDLTITNQNGESLSKMTPIEGTMNLITSSDTIAPTFSGEIPVEAIEQNLESFIGE